MTQISNFPINLRAEHYRVHVHVARSLAFLHLEHKDEVFAKELDRLAAVWNNLISPAPQAPTCKLVPQTVTDLQDRSMSSKM